jgi:hypothetical protein
VLSFLSLKQAKKYLQDVLLQLIPWSLFFESSDHPLMDLRAISSLLIISIKALEPRAFQTLRGRGPQPFILFQAHTNEIHSILRNTFPDLICELDLIFEDRFFIHKGLLAGK